MIEYVRITPIDATGYPYVWRRAYRGNSMLYLVRDEIGGRATHQFIPSNISEHWCFSISGTLRAPAIYLEHIGEWKVMGEIQATLYAEEHEIPR